MDQASQEHLQEILKISIDDLSLEDKRFLHGRRGYLTRSQQADYADVIDEVTEMNNQKLRSEGNIQQAEARQTPKAPKAQKKNAPKPQEENLSQDVHLDLDAPVKSEKQLAAEKAMEEAKRLQEEAAAEANNESETEETTDPEGDGAGESASTEEVECLDPDCTHENHQ